MNLQNDLLAGAVWLEKFAPFSPKNYRENDSLDKSIVQWGNFAIGYNLYPNLFNIFIKYSPTADALINKIVRMTFGNIPKDIKSQPTTRESVGANTIQSLCINAGRDYKIFGGSFALWVGYDAEGKIDEFKHMPIELIRYVERDETIYPHTENRYMIGILDGETNDLADVFYPYEPERAMSQMADWWYNRASDRTSYGESDGSKLRKGQILFYNTAAGGHTYPDCVFNAMVPILLSDVGIDTTIMSFIGNSDLLKTYKKESGITGADSANGFGGFADKKMLGSIWGLSRTQDPTSVPEVGSDYLNTGPKAAGSVEYIDVPEGSEALSNYVIEAKFPKFMDEVIKMDERAARRICVALDIPYEYMYKMEGGILNKDDREMLFAELNMRLEDPRDTFESVINGILERSIFDWRLKIDPIGLGKSDVAEANANVTE